MNKRDKVGLFGSVGLVIVLVWMISITVHLLNFPVWIKIPAVVTQIIGVVLGVFGFIHYTEKG